MAFDTFDDLKGHFKQNHEEKYKKIMKFVEDTKSVSDWIDGGCK